MTHKQYFNVVAAWGGVYLYFICILFYSLKIYVIL